VAADLFDKPARERSGPNPGPGFRLDEQAASMVPRPSDPDGAGVKVDVSRPKRVDPRRPRTREHQKADKRPLMAHGLERRRGSRGRPPLSRRPDSRAGRYPPLCADKVGTAAMGCARSIRARGQEPHGLAGNQRPIDGRGGSTVREHCIEELREVLTPHRARILICEPVLVREQMLAPDRLITGESGVLTLRRDH
jgi:hypothetical protein